MDIGSGRGTVAAFAIVVVLSTIVPVAAVATPDHRDDPGIERDRTIAGSTNVNVGGALVNAVGDDAPVPSEGQVPPRAQLDDAYATLGQVSVPGTMARISYQSTIVDVLAAQAAYRGPVHVSSPEAFRRGSSGLRGLAEFASGETGGDDATSPANSGRATFQDLDETDQARVTSGSASIAEAFNVTARWKISRVERVYERYRGNLSTSEKLRVARLLNSANRALDRADRELREADRAERAGDEPGVAIRHRARAVEQYGTAWQAADEATASMENTSAVPESIPGADGDVVTYYERVDRAVWKLSELDVSDDARSRAIAVLRAGDGTALQFVDEFEPDTLAPLLQYDGAGADEMWRTLADMYESGEVEAGQVDTFASDLEVLTENDVGGLEHVIDDDIAGSSPNNVQGALYEFRIASAYIEDVDDVAAIGSTRDTVEFDELTENQVDEIVSVVEFEDAETRSDKVALIEDALNPDSETELDVLKVDDTYVEAKSGGVRHDDIQAKIIRFTAHQLVGDLDDGGEMIVVTPGKYEFVKRRNGEPTKVGRLIENTEGIDWDTFELTPDG